MIKEQCTVYRQWQIFRKSHVIKLIKLLINFSYQNLSAMQVFNSYVVKKFLNNMFQWVYRVSSPYNASLKILIKAVKFNYLIWIHSEDINKMQAEFSKSGIFPWSRMLLEVLLHATLGRKILPFSLEIGLILKYIAGVFREELNL